MSRPVVPEFDLDRFLRNSRRVAVDDLPWDAVREHPLTNGEVRFLTYMMNIESHTIVYLRDLLGTSVIADPEVTAFLSCWAYEEFFHGYELERFLKLYCGEGHAVNDAGARLGLEGLLAAFLKRTLAPVVTAASPDFAATHMTWGATQELTTLHGYEAIIRGTRHPLLRELLQRVVKDERRHFAFYFKQADRRLARSPFMRKETRFLMERFWRPVGAGAMPDAEVDFISWFLFRDETGRAALRTVDETIARLPGMEGWRGLERHTERHIAAEERRAADAAWANSVRPPAGTVAPAPRAA